MMFQRFESLVLGLVAVSAATGVAGVPLAHEARGQRPSDPSTKRSRVASDAVLPVRIGLTQSNLDRGYDHLMRIASPSSPDYGKHWTKAEVDAEFAPSAEAADTVTKWLQEAGIADARQTTNKGWIAFDARADQVEELFRTKFYEYESGQDGSVRLGCDHYDIPEHVAAAVDYITPGVKLSPLMRSQKVKRNGHGLQSWLLRPGNMPSSWPSNWTLPAGASFLPPELQHCGFNITPPCLRALYNIPFPSGKLAAGTIGVFEEYDVYAQGDLDEYFANYAPYVPNGTHPTLVSINGATAPVSQQNYSDTGESDIDFSIVYGLLGAVDVTLYQTQDPGGGQSLDQNVTIFDPFLDAVDGSFCDDTERQMGFQCGGAPLTTVISASYEVPELGYQPRKSQERVCNEFMKLALQGHTAVFSSGDYGVATNPGFGDALCINNGCYPADLNNDGYDSYNGTIFNVNFPSNCPYVLSVGGTQLDPSQTVYGTETALNIPGIGFASCDGSVEFSSSGGFSNYFPRPSYQDQALSEYFTFHDPGYPYYPVSSVDVSDNATTIGQNEGIYSRYGRGFPDVSANGAHLSAFIAGESSSPAGTSLSTPIWASILALINSDRAAIGKGPVGFVHPVLYENPWMFHDIVNGSNPGCGTAGFEATPGWDPITGLGTPNYPLLRDVFLGLP